MLHTIACDACRPGVFYTIKMDGCLDVWDYFYKQNDPTLQVWPKAATITCSKVYRPLLSLTFLTRVTLITLFMLITLVTLFMLVTLVTLFMLVTLITLVTLVTVSMLFA